MKKTRSILALMMALCMMLTAVGALAEQAPEEDANADQGPLSGTALLEAVKGTYVPLFPVITDPQYDALWLDPCSAILGEEGMFGGIVGASMGSVMTNCEAQADIVVDEGKTANIGIVGGGWQNTSAAGCVGHGSITLGSGCYGVGGVSGCGFGAEYFKDCAAE